MKKEKIMYAAALVWKIICFPLVVLPISIISSLVMGFIISFPLTIVLSVLGPLGWVPWVIGAFICFGRSLEMCLEWFYGTPEEILETTLLLPLFGLLFMIIFSAVLIGLIALPALLPWWICDFFGASPKIKSLIVLASYCLLSFLFWAKTIKFLE